ncbi:hypothetical protein A3D03_05945 [Candidatus Gottesmanbacteria bacterium RIFCSPHIGHO2_02_FULL_40_13]|uniref:Cysteine--tRNA ligase n=1 Tax=Candidatus Gottesmanbacteria bacterium RIFCSPHIGHO2_02_FULL_40_13 TaxID=1798384 RepID=A0A1F6A6K1_9BACT|nr:MAG: hypothetical protein A3D03_05945 [Candidatus Gottesmanbacteria bacterium RIFCSPHIGHO2_02_FULL_40_13]
MLYLFNTLTHRKEEFTPLHPPLVTYYSCGPTVYDFAHIGHARTFIFADILQRVLEFNNFKVKRVMNITDVGHLTSDRDSGEDKMEKGAKRENKSVWDIAEFYTQDFMLMLKRLNIQVPETICKATDNIKEMIDLINILEKKGFTYQIADGVYFNTSKFSSYGGLTGMTLLELQKNLKAGSRVEMVEGKKHPTDFALWKFSYPNGRSFGSPSNGLRVNAQDDVSSRRQMEWDSPWGKGFPGWHIECSAMSMKYLGNTIDIHTGGADHIPIHHTNEIAQSEAASGKIFVRFWLHAQHLTVEGAKMSKSLHNFYRLKDINEKGFDNLALRYLYLTAHYRTAMNFTWKAMEGAQRAFDQLRRKLLKIKEQRTVNKKIILSEEKREKVKKFQQKFTEVINDDLNTAAGLAIVWDVVKSDITPGDKYDLIMLFDKILGLDLSQITDNREQRTIPVEIKELVEKREELRRVQKWDEADKVRIEIEGKGFLILDSKDGTKVKRN